MRTHEVPAARQTRQPADRDPALAREAERPCCVPVPVPGLTASHTDAASEPAVGGTETALARLQRLARRSSAGDNPVGAAGGPLGTATTAAIHAQLGTGAGLPTDVQRRMEEGFGTSLRHVRVHEGAEADRLSTALSARAFTVGDDVFLGRLATRAPDAEAVLAHEIAHVLTEPAGQVRRWFQPEPPPRTQPLSTCPPRGKGQPTGIRWEEVKQDPRGDVHRFVDGSDVGWEAPDAKTMWKRNDWHKAAEKAKQEAATWWYDLTGERWQKGKPPDTHRVALPGERVDLTGKDLKGYASTNAVPMYKKAKYRPTKTSKKTKSHRGPGLRALDRTARLLMTDIPKESTPHLATGTARGRLFVAGNTGKRFVTTKERGRADENLTTALDPGAELGDKKPRFRKDATKLRALQSGDYAAHHARAEAELGTVSAALGNRPLWRNVGVSRGDAEHGEMTVLAELDRELQASPNAGPLIVRSLGGVKLACAACKLAFEAYNRFIAGPLGYSVKVSGTHGGFYEGWRCPDVIWNNAAALKYVRDGLPEEGRLDDGGVLRDIVDSTAGYHDPDESDSEWEEV